MTRAERLHHLLKEIKRLEKEPLIATWKQLFEVSNIIEVYDRLKEVKIEIDAFELEISQLGLSKDPQFKRVITTLNNIIEYPNINAPLQNQAYMKNETINITYAAFSMFKSFVDAQHVETEYEDELPDDELKKFQENIQKVIEEIELSAMPEKDKEVFLSVFFDLNKAVSLYKVNGLHSFINVIRNNICKIQIITEYENKEKNANLEKFKLLTKKAVGTVWVWSITYVKKRTFALIESKAIKYLDDHAKEWAALATSDSNDGYSDVIDAEIENEE